MFKQISKACICAAMITAGFATAAPKSGFIPLFNGNNFDGWHLKIRNKDPELAKQVFAIEDGMIHVFNDSFPDGYDLVDKGDCDSHGLFFTNKQYTNYVLRFEYKWGDKQVNNFKQFQYDAGVYYHVTNESIWPTGIEYQLRYDHTNDQNHTGDLIRPRGITYDWFQGETRVYLHPNDGGVPEKKKGWLHPAAATDNYHALDNQWNQCEIVVMGDQYSIHKLNGDVVNMAFNLNPSAGTFGFQAETAEIFYRNIEIKEFDTPQPMDQFLRTDSTKKANHILYIYGDVSAKGVVPSGKKPPFHQMRLDDTGDLGLSQFRDALTDAGFTITEQYDQSIRFDKASLQYVDVLILGSNQRKFEPSEVTTVKEWVEQGGGLVAWSDSAFGGDYRFAGINNTLGRDSNNLITEQFGMHFLTDNGGGNYLISQFEKDHFINRNQKDGGIRFRGEGVSFIRTSPPAQMLAKAQSGGLGGEMEVGKIDGVFDVNTDAALAIAEIGKGRVVGIFDRNLFWNAGAGSRLSHSDNREFTQRVMLWAAGTESESRIPIKPKNETLALNTPPEVTITHKVEGLTVYFTAVISDTDNDGVSPEISWRQKKGSVKGTFENNNPNTLAPTVTLPQKGVYIFDAIIDDGEFRIKRRITIDLS